jgi:Protein of unknown function (DUF760)
VAPELNPMSNFWKSEPTTDREPSESLMRYIQSLNPETIAHLSRPASPETIRMMEHNIVGLLGVLPGEQFDVSITTNREHLGRLLASAMMSGYFLRNAEQRMSFEKSLQNWSGDLAGDAPTAD